MIVKPNKLYRIIKNSNNLFKSHPKREIAQKVTIAVPKYMVYVRKVAEDKMWL